MKKIIFICGIFTFNNLHAQLEKGTFYTGVYMDLLPNHSIGRKTLNIGAMLSDKWALGGEFSYQYAGNHSSTLFRNTTIFLNTRYYFVNEKTFSFFGNASIGYNHTILNYPTIQYNQRLFPAKIGLGISYFLCEKVSVDLQSNLIFNTVIPSIMIEGKMGLHYYFRPVKTKSNITSF
jgi:hypothetical protein